MIKKFDILFLICLFAATKLSAQLSDTDSSGFTRFYYGNGQVSSEGYIIDGKPDGYWKTYYVGGILKSEGNRRNQLLDSTWIFFDMDGDTTQVISYFMGKKNGYYATYEYFYEKNGDDSIKKGGLTQKELYLNDKKEGQSLFFYSDGKLKQTIYYNSNKKHGPGKEFDNDGRLITLFEFHNDYQTNKEKINRYDNQNKKTGIWKEFYPNDKLHIEASYYKDSLNGFYREYDKKGQIIKMYLYDNGLLVNENPVASFDSLKIEIKNEYHPNGKIKFSKAYKPDGTPIGTHREYNEKEEVVNAWLYNSEGQLLGMGIVDEEGKKQGDWIFYHETGEIMAEGKYINNDRLGKWDFKFENGNIEQSGKYKSGKPEGEWTWYYSSGQVRRQENFDKGKEEGSFTEYYTNGELIAKGDYISGEKNGNWYYKVGDQIEKGAYLDGMKDGIWESYYLNGDLSFRGNFMQGSEDGKHKYFYENGKLKLEVNYMMGRKEGKWIEYNELGEMLNFIIFRNDQEYKINGNRYKFYDEDDF